MDFELPESHQFLQRKVREFCAKRVAPLSRDWDERGTFPHEIIPELAEMGFLGICAPEELGGAEMDCLAFALCVEELARVDGSLALTVASHNGLGLAHLLAAGTEAQKQRYVPAAVSGKSLASWAMTEPGAGSDCANISMRARREDAHWILNGSKSFISQGSVAGFCIVVARTDEGSSASNAMTAFIVERGTPGFEVTRIIEKYGCRSSDTAELVFRDCRVHECCRIGGVGAAFYDTLRILDRGRIAIAAMALGLGRSALDAALKYATERKTFGQKIGHHQAIAFMLADARTKLDAAELLIHRAAWLADRGSAFSLEASIAKLFASEASTKICNDALQIHGGYGYSREFPVERYLRDTKICEIGEGTSEIQRLLIARHLLGRQL